MREKGISHLNGYNRGDQLVRINIWVPSKLTSKEKELLKELGTNEHIVPNEEERHGHSKTLFSKMKDAFS